LLIADFGMRIENQANRISIIEPIKHRIRLLIADFGMRIENHHPKWPNSPFM
jgi:hypothetical protein